MYTTYVILEVVYAVLMVTPACASHVDLDYSYYNHLSVSA